MSKSGQIERFVDFFKNNNTSPSNFKIGAEFEHFVLKKESLQAVSYYEENGIKDILQTLEKSGWNGIYEKGNIIGAKKDGSYLSLEPGGQLEISLKPVKEIKEIEKDYLNTIKQILKICESYDYYLVTLGYQPKSKIDDIPWLPKERYKLMSSYFAENGGKYAHNMMKGTSSLQVAIDYSSEKDFVRKIRAAYILAPLLSYLFDNSPFFEGEVYNGNMLRTKIWNNCDDDRCRLLPDLFSDEFGFERYSEYVLNRSPIFIIDKKGNIKFWDKPLKKIMDPKKWDLDQIKHALSMVFPDVRAREFIEIRMVDSLNYPLNFAYIMLIKNIFYKEEILDFILDYFSNYDQEKLLQLNREIIQKGSNTLVNGKKVYSFLKILLNKILKLVEKNEKKCLLSILNLIDNEISPAIRLKKCYKNNRRKIVDAVALNNVEECSKCCYCL